MYKAGDDPYCYPGTTVLKNRLHLRRQEELDRFEAFISTQRADEPFPTGNLDFRHYCAIHRHLFQDVYAWAGRIRTVRMSKGTSTFCYPEHIERELRRVFSDLRADGYFRQLDAATFAGKAAHLLAELNEFTLFVRETAGPSSHS
jgi:cell filamentation protein